MAFFENICPNGQFVSAIQAGEYAVEQPNQARAEILDVSDWLAEMSEKSITERQKDPIARMKNSR